jgi:hypothetical protein
MHRSAKKLTRRELYDLVWSKPIMKLAEDFGISDRGLGKICARYRVPVPPRGYWAKVAAGKKVKQTRFHEVSDPALNRIEISPSTWNLPDETKTILRDAKRKREQSKTVSNPTSFHHVEKPHPVLVGIANRLRKNNLSQRGSQTAFVEDRGGIVVHEQQAERAISFLDKLVRALDDKGLIVTPKKDNIEVATTADTIKFTLREKTRREEYKPTDAETRAWEAQERRRDQAQQYLARRLMRSWDKPWPEYKTVFTGQLVFVIDGWFDGMRRTWADGKTQTIESNFDRIVIGLEAALAFEKSRRKAAAERERQYAEMARRRALAVKRQEREDKRVTFLNELIASQTEAERIRGWLDTFQADESELRSDLSRFVSWAQDRLVSLEEQTSANHVSQALIDMNLFPEFDDLDGPDDSTVECWELLK